MRFHATKDFNERTYAGCLKLPAFSFQGAESPGKNQLGGIFFTRTKLSSRCRSSHTDSLPSLVQLISRAAQASQAFQAVIYFN